MFDDVISNIKNNDLKNAIAEGYSVFSKAILEAAGVNGGAGIMLVNRVSGKILLCKRSPDSDAPNQWCGLGGGIEDGETPIEGARRELMEEASISEDMYEQVGDEPIFIHNTASGFTFTNYIAYCSEVEPVLNDEHSEYRWFSITEMVELKDLHYGYRIMLSTPDVYDKIVTVINSR